MPELPVTFDDVRRAAAVIDGRVRRTPVFSCASLGEGIWLKAELLQRTGAFKVRGAFSRIAELTEAERARGVVTCSAGNHAAAVALAGRELGTHALVMMPRNASQPKVDATRAYGGTADLESADAAEAFARMDAEAEASGPRDRAPVQRRRRDGRSGHARHRDLRAGRRGHAGRRAGRRRRADRRRRDGRQGARAERPRDRRRAGRDRDARLLDRRRRAGSAPARHDARRCARATDDRRARRSRS